MRGPRHVTVVIPAHDEDETIASVVHGFAEREDVERVVVVDNRCTDETATRAQSAGAEVIEEARAGYGHALHAGLEHAFASGADACVLVEADGSFSASDVALLLAPLHDDGVTLVLGTRTHRSFVQPGAHMGPLLRTGNRAVAALVRLAWPARELELTDVGCTFRALTKDAWRALSGELTEAGPGFSVEMICVARLQGLRWVEVPVRYGPRLGGRSKHSTSFVSVARTAFAMLGTVCRKRLRARGRS